MLIKARTMVRAILLDRAFIGNSNDWYWKEHCRTVKFPPSTNSWPVMNMINSIADYIDNFADNNCGSDICSDYLASEYLEPMISAVGNLLNYDIGRLDAGKVSEALSYLRMCLHVGTNPVGTMPSDHDIKRFARIMWECWNKKK